MERTREIECEVEALTEIEGLSFELVRNMGKITAWEIRVLAPYRLPSINGPAPKKLGSIKYRAMERCRRFLKGLDPTTLRKGSGAAIIRLGLPRKMGFSLWGGREDLPDLFLQLAEWAEQKRREWDQLYGGK